LVNEDRPTARGGGKPALDSKLRSTTKYGESRCKKQNGESTSNQHKNPHHGNKFRPISLQEFDIVGGRGGKIQNRKGNEFFRRLVKNLHEFYENAKEKKLVAKSIVLSLEKQNPPSRFVEFDKKNGHYYELEEDKKIQKVSQAIRDINKSQEAAGRNDGHSSQNGSLADIPPTIAMNESTHRLFLAWEDELRARLLPPRLGCLERRHHSSSIRKAAAKLCEEAAKYQHKKLRAKFPKKLSAVKRKHFNFPKGQKLRERLSDMKKEYIRFVERRFFRDKSRFTKNIIHFLPQPPAMATSVNNKKHAPDTDGVPGDELLSVNDDNSTGLEEFISSFSENVENELAVDDEIDCDDLSATKGADALLSAEGSCSTEWDNVSLAAILNEGVEHLFDSNVQFLPGIEF